MCSNPDSKTHEVRLRRTPCLLHDVNEHCDLRLNVLSSVSSSKRFSVLRRTITPRVQVRFGDRYSQNDTRRRAISQRAFRCLPVPARISQTAQFRATPLCCNSKNRAILLLLFLLAARRKTPKQVTKHARTEYPFRIPTLKHSHSATPSRKLHTQTTPPAIHHRVTKSPQHSNPETRRHPTPETIRAQYLPTYRATIKHRHKPRRWKCNTTRSYYSTRQRSRVMKQRKEEVEEETEISSRKNNSAASAAGERRGRAVHVGQAGHDRRGRTGKSVPTGRTDLPSAG